MKAQCLPFQQIPHTTKLFADFLAWDPKIQSFYSRPAQFLQWIKDETALVSYDPERRARVASILERQNKTWGASQETLDNIARLRAGASAVVTGQQVGFLGGPVFSLYKALTAIKLAKEATAAGIECVPVFWLATEDHDLEEVSQIGLPLPDGSRQKLTAAAHGIPNAPVGAVTLGPEVEDAKRPLIERLGDSSGVTLLENYYLAGETLGAAFARLFAHLFADWGVILLDAMDSELHKIAQPIYRAAIERASELHGRLVERGKELDTAGYHQQVKVTPSSTLLFVMRDGARVALHRSGEGLKDSAFLLGDEKTAQPELLHRVETAPQDFSANVLLRPVVQDYLLPTLAYTGGSAETAYFAQSAVVYQSLVGRVTPIIPRFSGTLLEQKHQALLERYGLSLTDVFHGTEALRERLAAQTLPDELQAAFDHAGVALKQSLERIREVLARFDKTLVDAAANSESKMEHQLESLRARAARAELRQSEVLARHAEVLTNALYPEKTLQEREVAAIYFVGRYGSELLHLLYNCIHTDCLDHQVITLP